MKARILALSAVIGMIILLSGCMCQHEWINADCINPKTCRNCGKTVGETLPHTWLEATCEEPITCSYCAQTDGAPLGHQEGDWEFLETDFNSAEQHYGKYCRTCGKLTISESRKMDSLIEGNDFLLNPEQFYARYYSVAKQEALDFLDHEPEFMIWFLDGYEYVDGQSPMDKIAIGWSMEQHTLSALTTMAMACDPALSSEDAAALASLLMTDMSLDRNGLKYTYNFSPALDYFWVSVHIGS